MFDSLKRLLGDETVLSVFKGVANTNKEASQHPS